MSVERSISEKENCFIVRWGRVSPSDSRFNKDTVLMDAFDDDPGIPSLVAMPAMKAAAVTLTWTIKNHPHPQNGPISGQSSGMRLPPLEDVDDDEAGDTSGVPGLSLCFKL